MAIVAAKYNIDHAVKSSVHGSTTSGDEAIDQFQFLKNLF
jgi:hypothetical protein